MPGDAVLEIIILSTIIVLTLVNIFLVRAMKKGLVTPTTCRREPVPRSVDDRLRVKIGSVLYDSGDVPIMLLVPEYTKRQIGQMSPEAHKFCSYPDDIPEDVIRKWMDEVPEPSILMAPCLDDSNENKRVYSRDVISKAMMELQDSPLPPEEEGLSLPDSEATYERAMKRSQEIKARSSQGVKYVERTQDEIVQQLEEEARKRFGVTADEMVQWWRDGVLDCSNSQEVIDLISLAGMLDTDHPLYVEP